MKGKPPVEADYEVITNETLKDEELPPVIIASEEEVVVLGALARGSNPQDAMRAAGLNDDKAVAEAYCGKVTRKYNDEIQEALTNHGISVSSLVEVMADQLEARKPVVVAGEGMQMVPDNAARQGAVNLVMDVLPGVRAPKKVEHEVKSFEQVLMSIKIEHGE